MLKDLKAKTYMIIAAYNEEKNIKQTIQNLLDNGWKNIIVVDDASKDDTFKILKQFSNITIFKHRVNMGQGAALRMGIQIAINLNADYIVTYDGDGQHRVEDIHKIVKPVYEGNTDVTLGSRFLNLKSEIPIFRIVTLKIGIIVQFLFYGILLTDAHNGFRCFSLDAAKKIKITENRMAHASQIIQQIGKHKLRYQEVPVIIKYTEDTLKKGHGGLKTAIGVFWKMFLLKFKG
jgi:polyprenyl-phospho-N-acetylgalactosaminyl synthase